MAWPPEPRPGSARRRRTPRSHRSIARCQSLTAAFAWFWHSAGRSAVERWRSAPFAGKPSRTTSFVVRSCGRARDLRLMQHVPWLSRGLSSPSLSALHGVPLSSPTRPVARAWPRAAWSPMTATPPHMTTVVAVLDPAMTFRRSPIAAPPASTRTGSSRAVAPLLFVGALLLANTAVNPREDREPARSSQPANATHSTDAAKPTRRATADPGPPENAACQLCQLNGAQAFACCRFAGGPTRIPRGAATDSASNGGGSARITGRSRACSEDPFHGSGVLLMQSSGRALLALALAACLATIGLAGLAGAVLSPASVASGGPGDIPPAYLDAYRSAADRFALGADGWSYLAAIGKVESTTAGAPRRVFAAARTRTAAAPGRCRSTTGSAPAARPGARTRSTATATGAPTSTTSTTQRQPRRGTSRRPARRRTGARRSSPTTTPSGTSTMSSRRRPSTAPKPSRPSPAARVGPLPSGTWLADVPGAPGERCDRRIVADVAWLIRTLRLASDRLLRRRAACDCGRASARARDRRLPGRRELGSNPPARQGRGVGPSCAPRVVPIAGRSAWCSTTATPATATRDRPPTPHLHVSWEHGEAAPFSPAPWVRVLRSGVVRP